MVLHAFIGRVHGRQEVAKSPRIRLASNSQEHAGRRTNAPGSEGTAQVNKQLVKRLKRISKRILGPNLDRVVLEKETRLLIEKLDVTSLSVLEISGQRWRKFGFRSYRSVEYPEFDITADLVLSETFDLVIAEQVFEHVAYPYRAGKNVYQLLNAGGYFLISTPFLQKVHNFPIDCCRWTETGMKYFLSECGFEPQQIETGSWGNRHAARANLRFRESFPRRNLFFGSWKNDPTFPVQVWALARK